MGFGRIARCMAAGVAILLAGCASISGPTVTPEDVLLTATIRPADDTVCLPEVRWVLEVELDRSRAVPLILWDHEEYMSEVNAFNGERPLQVSVGDGCANGHQDSYKGLSLGNDGRTYTLAARTAHRTGDLPEDTWPDTKSSASGFFYSGNEFPIKVRYYLDGTEPPSRRIAVIYAHYEKRFGRDLSWTKTIYAPPPLP
jgi:hypothetical protein